MKKMTCDTAMQMIKKYTGRPDLSEDEIILFGEALEYMREHEFFCENAWLFNLGYFYDTIGKYDLAVKYFTTAIDQGDTVSYIGLADTYRHMGEYEKAKDYYIKAAVNGFERRAYRALEAMGYGIDQTQR